MIDNDIDIDIDRIIVRPPPPHSAKGGAVETGCSDLYAVI